MERTDSGLIFRTRWGFNEVELTLWQVGHDLVPTLYGEDPETTERWMDFLLRQQLRQSGVPVRSISLLTAGKVLPAVQS
jgi:hypothetical protein